MPLRSRSAGIAIWLSWAAAACSVPAGFCRAHDLTVHVINVKDGSGVKELPIWVWFGDEKVKGPPLRITTTATGSAAFPLPSPQPRTLLVYTEVSGKIGSCSVGNFTTEQIVEHGVVATIRKYRKCRGSTALTGKFTARPGEVYVFVRFLGWFERMQE